MPRTLAQNAQYIAETIKPAIKSAIEAQGVTVPSTDSFLDYADRIGEIEGGGSGYQLKDLPTGSISTVTDAAELPLNALKVSVEAWQEGTGDPSPSNIRPIHGWDSGEISVVGKNWFNKNDSSILTDRRISTGNGNTYTSSGSSVSEYIEVLESVSYTLTTGRTAYYAWYSESAYISGGSWGDGGSNVAPTGAKRIRFDYPTDNVDAVQFEIGTTATTYEPYQGKQYTLDFPSTIYGAEWDVVNGGMMVTHMAKVFSGNDYLYKQGNLQQYACAMPDAKDYSASLVGDQMFDKLEAVSRNTLTRVTPYTAGISNNNYIYFNLPFDTVEEVNEWLTENPVTYYYKLKAPTAIDLSPLSIRLLEGTNNLYADCGEVIEGEYFVDEGVIDVRKVDYSIGSNSTLKISNGRILQGFASMTSYHARPLDASGNWLDVDWSKDFEIGVAFKFMAFPAYQSIFGDGNANSYRKAPRIYYDNSEGKLALCVSSDGSTLAIDTYLNYTFAVDKWYFIKAKFVLSTMTFTVDISDDFSTFTSLYSGVMASAPYHNTASLSLGGEAQQSNMASNTFLIDSFNTYIKGDGVSWGASTGAFPS